MRVGGIVGGDESGVGAGGRYVGFAAEGPEDAVDEKTARGVKLEVARMTEAGIKDAFFGRRIIGFGNLTRPRQRLPLAVFLAAGLHAANGVAFD